MLLFVPNEFSWIFVLDVENESMQKPKQPHRTRSFIRTHFFDALFIAFLIGGAFALLVPTVSGPGPRGAGREARMGIEIGQLSQALEAFRLEHGVYPPDFSGDDEDDRKAIELMLEQLSKPRED